MPHQKPKQREQANKSLKKAYCINQFRTKLSIDPYFKIKHRPIQAKNITIKSATN